MYNNTEREEKDSHHRILEWSGLEGTL